MGAFAAISGTGGGSLNVPIFDLMLGDENHDISKATSSFVIFINSISTNFAYGKQKRIDYKTAGILLIFSLPMSVIGVIVTNLISDYIQEGKIILIIIFYAFILFLGIRILRKKQNNSEAQMLLNSDEKGIMACKLIDRDGNCFEYAYKLKKVIPFALLGGFASGFFGIGGGTVQVPLMHNLCGMSIHIAVATSGFMVLFNSLVSFITQMILGKVDIIFGLFFAAGTLIGAQIGAKIAKGTSNPKLKKVIGIIFICIAIYKAVSLIFF